MQIEPSGQFASVTQPTQLCVAMLQRRLLAGSQSVSSVQPTSQVFVEGLQYWPVTHISLCGRQPTQSPVVTSQTPPLGSFAQSASVLQPGSMTPPAPPAADPP